MVATRSHRLQFQMGEYSIKGLLLEKRKVYICSYEKKLDEIYTGEIHVFAKMYNAEYTDSTGIVARPCSIFAKNKDNQDLICLCTKVSHR